MENPNFRIGMTASEVVVEIVRVNPKISYLGFYAYKPHYNIQEMFRGKKRGTPLLPQLLTHDSSKDTITLERKDITVEGLNKTIGSLEEDVVLGVLSEVEIEDQIFHIPMMDFSCFDSPENLAKIEHFLDLIGYHEGVILFSGRSYHYYGVELMSKEHWLVFLGDCLLSGLLGELGERYVGHRLKDGCGILRISAGGLRSEIPRVISIL